MEMSNLFGEKIAFYRYFEILKGSLNKKLTKKKIYSNIFFISPFRAGFLFFSKT